MNIKAGRDINIQIGNNNVNIRNVNKKPRALRAVVCCFHKYQPFGHEFYEPILDFFLAQMKKYEDEFDHLYLVDSNWGVEWTPERNSDRTTVIRVDPHLRYYDAYKEVLPQIKEDLVLFMDNDMVVYREGMIEFTFDLLTKSLPWSDGEEHIPCDVVTIIDQIGEYKTGKLKNGNKFCPYWFGTRKDLLLNYVDIEWGPNMPKHETLGKLTEEMLNDGVKVFEWEEDKSNILFNSTQDGEQSKNLGYYHIRAGSTPAYLLAEKKYGNKETYESYLKNQPKTEYLRQLAWYDYMVENSGGNKNLYTEIWMLLSDVSINHEYWNPYCDKFRKYHGLV